MTEKDVLVRLLARHVLSHITPEHCTADCMANAILADGWTRVLPLIEYRAHRYECLRCGARLMSMMQFNGRECPGPRQQEVTAPIAPEGITPDGARYAAHLIRKRSKGDRFHPRRPETAAAMLAAADWLDQFATRDLPPGKRDAQ